MTDASRPPRLTFAEKVWRDHVVASLGDGVDLLYIDRHFLHELSGAMSFQGLDAAGRTVFDRRLTFATVDHVVDTRPGRGLSSCTPGGDGFIRGLVDGVARHRIAFFGVDDPRQGIAHVIAAEQGIALPGTTFVCGDSHTTTVGAVGALAWGIGSTDGEQVLATQTLMMQRPRTMRVSLDGRLPEGTTAKDVVLKLIATIGAGGASGHAVEFTGDVVRAMTVGSRATLCNMATEMSARMGFVPCDDVTLDYLHGRPFAPAGQAWDDAVAAWRSLASDDDAVFDAEVRLDCSDLQPFVTWGTSPEHAAAIGDRVPLAARRTDAVARADFDRALDYMGLAPGQPLAGLPISGAFIGSCTNSRLDDLREAADVLRGRRVASGVRAVCTPGSRDGQARRRGRRHRRGLQGGGLRMARAGLLAVHERRRRELRAGIADRQQHEPQLRGPARPSRAVASRESRDGRGVRRCRRARRSADVAGRAGVMEPFETHTGRAALLLRDNVDTDQIIPGRELMKTTTTGFGDGLFAEWRYLDGRVDDPAFVLNRHENRGASILVTGRNFGCGSSREAAAWAVRDYGFRAVIAPSFSGIFHANCLKNGVLPVVLDDESHAALVRSLASAARPLTVDLDACRVSDDAGHAWSFRVAKVDRELLRKGMRAIDYALSFRPEIEAFREADRVRRPWVYPDTERVAGAPR